MTVTNRFYRRDEPQQQRSLGLPKVVLAVASFRARLARPSRYSLRHVRRLVSPFPTRFAQVPSGGPTSREFTFGERRKSVRLRALSPRSASVQRPRRAYPDIGKCVAAPVIAMDRVAARRDRVDGDSCITERDGEPGRIRPFECRREQDPWGHEAETAGRRLGKGHEAPPRLQGAGDAAGRKARAIGETQHRSEAVRGDRSNEEEPAHGRSKPCREDGRILDTSDLGPKGLVEELEAVDVDPIAGRGDHVVVRPFARRSVPPSAE